MTVSTIKGRNFVRAAIAKGVTGDFGEAQDYAISRWPRAWPPVVKAMGAVTSGDTGNVEAVEFFSLVAERSLLGQVIGLRRVPFNIRYLRMSAGTRGTWISEREPIPVSKAVLTGGVLERRKVAAIALFTQESLNAVGPVAEAAFQADLINAGVLAMDDAFIDASNAGVDGQTPASVTYGGVKIDGTADAVADVKAAIAGFSGDLSAAFWVTDGKTAAALGLVQAANGGSAFPAAGARGGDILGIPLVTTQGSPYSNAEGGQLALIDPTGIAFQSEGMDITQSSAALIDVDNAPDEGTSKISLFQSDTAALKLVVWANWEQQRAGGAVVIVGCKY